MVSENKKIIASITFVLIFALSMLITYEKIDNPSHANDRKREQKIHLNGHMTGRDLYASDFSNDRVVFLLGSSHLGSANVTTINQLLFSNTKNNTIPVTGYNLAAFGDKPTIRVNSIKEIIATHPKAVFYQLSYRDFEFSYEDTNTIPVDFKDLFFSKIFSVFVGHIPVNPQELLFSILRPIQGKLAPSLEESLITNDKTPFYHYTDFHIKSEDELRSESSPAKEWQNPKTSIENYRALKQIIEQAENNKIKIVLFTSPLHTYYTDKLSEKQKGDFVTILKEIHEQYGVKIYDFENKYTGLDVWGNISHISYNKTVTVYNEDIARMITEET